MQSGATRPALGRNMLDTEMQTISYMCMNEDAGTVFEKESLPVRRTNNKDWSY